MDKAISTLLRDVILQLYKSTPGIWTCSVCSSGRKPLDFELNSIFPKTESPTFNTASVEANFCCAQEVYPVGRACNLWKLHYLVHSWGLQDQELIFWAHAGHAPSKKPLCVIWYNAIKRMEVPRDTHEDRRLGSCPDIVPMIREKVKRIFNHGFRRIDVLVREHDEHFARQRDKTGL